MVGTYLDWRGYLPVNTYFSLILQILSQGYVVEDMDISKTFDFYKVHLRQDFPYLSRGISGVAADIGMHTTSSVVAYLRHAGGRRCVEPRHAGCAPRAGLRKSVVAMRRSFLQPLVDGISQAMPQRMELGLGNIVKKHVGTSIPVNRFWIPHSF